MLKHFKDDIARKVAFKTGESQVLSKIMVDAVLTVIEQSLVDGHQVSLKKFGVFETRPKRGGVKRNPRKNIEVRVAAGRRPHFRASNALKKRIDNK